MINSKSQTLITGTYRSGSEYLTLLLDSHPELSATMYRVNLIRFIFKQYDPISNPRNLELALSDTNKRLFTRYNIQFDYTKVLKKIIGIVSYNYGNIYDAIMCDLYINENCTHWAEKNQLMWREIPTFIGMLPNAKAVHVVRDPRSVLASFKKYTKYKYPACISSIFNSYDALKTAIEQKQYLYQSVKLIRYEDLIDSSEDIIQEVWKFIGLSTNHDIKKDNFLDSYGKRWFSNSSFHKNIKNDKFDNNSAKMGWSERLEREEIMLVELVCGELMEFFGYKKIFKNIDESEAIKVFKNDEKIENYYFNWKNKRVGIEEFPADPLDKLTWE